jgi:soluble lytic murein transglycosylase
MQLPRKSLLLGGSGAALILAIALGLSPKDQPAPPAADAHLQQTPAPASAPAPAPAPISASAPALASASAPTTEASPSLRSVAPISTAPQLPLETAGLREALAAYAAGDLEKGDREAARVADPLARLTLDWIALQKERGPSALPRLLAFLSAQPDWPTRAALERRVEEILFWDKTRANLVSPFFAQRQPQSAAGRLLLARDERANGKEPQARARIAQVWRQDDLTPALETQVLKDFGDLLTPADHKARAIRLAYGGKAGALRAANLAGEDVTALIKARLAQVNDTASDTMMQAVPETLRKDPLYLLSQAQRLRRKGELEGAAKWIESAPRDRLALVDPDEWWTERRVLARKLLDEKKPDLAYTLAAHHSANGREQFIEAEFHAGWIALRFLQDAKKAAPHFARAAQRAETPISRARAAYWQGRAAEAQSMREEARQFYTRAAQEQTVYYGQLAREKLGLMAQPLRMPAKIAEGDQRITATRMVEWLYALGENESATSLAIDLGRALHDEAQLAALAKLATSQNDARASLAIGKQGVQRGLPLETAAFPLNGIPPFEAANPSAPLHLVKAIARQESAFHPRALSPAGAKGLMQMIDTTAQRTAQHIGVAFEKNKLLDEPAYNARLGAAHLAHLLADFKGSHILTFVAYNAGPRRAREWIAAYGDPRDPAIDPVDWVERIPFSETRNYVQRVMENLEIYGRLTGTAEGSTLRAELRTEERRL